MEIAPELRRLYANPTQIYQVLLNLCVNARDAMPHGGVLTITASNATLDEAAARALPGSMPGSYTVLGVSDTGTGIPPEIVGPHFRSVLHHQADRRRHGPRPVDRALHHEGLRRLHRALDAGRPGHDLPCLFPGDGNGVHGADRRGRGGKQPRRRRACAGGRRRGVFPRRHPPPAGGFRLRRPRCRRRRGGRAGFRAASRRHRRGAGRSRHAGHGRPDGDEGHPGRSTRRFTSSRSAGRATRWRWRRAIGDSS